MHESSLFISKPETCRSQGKAWEERTQHPGPVLNDSLSNPHPQLFLFFHLEAVDVESEDGKGKEKETGIQDHGKETIPVSYSPCLWKTCLLGL